MRELLAFFKHFKVANSLLCRYRITYYWLWWNKYWDATSRANKKTPSRVSAEHHIQMQDMADIAHCIQAPGSSL